MPSKPSKPAFKSCVTPVPFQIQNALLAGGALIAIGLCLVAAGCGQGSSSAATGGTTGSAGMVGTTGTGGAAAIAGSGTGGAPSEGTGGAATGTGGASSGGGGASTGTGGNGGSVGQNAATGGTAAVGAGGSTAVGVACTTQAKGGVCITPTDSCAKTCGPKNATNVSTGTKTETCTADAYVEGACAFPAGDYSCFKVNAATAACPAATAANGACTITSCMPCSGYADSTGAAKVGFCHCVNSKWSCGSAKEWPCQATGVSTSPGGTGC